MSPPGNRAFLLRFVQLCGLAIFIATAAAGPDVSRATSILYVIPICLIAVGVGMLCGLVTAAAATGALFGSILLGFVPEISTEGVVARIVAFFTTGAMTGTLADAIRAQASRLQTINERLVTLANTDDLTGLANRRAFKTLLCQHLEQAERRGWRGAILAIDVDRLKTVNDRLGHDAGDGLLIDVADRLRSNLRSDDVIARLGGDEFAVLLQRADREAAEAIATKLTDAISGTNVVVEDSIAQVGTASIGVALIEGQVSADALMREADSVLYQAKRQGGRCVATQHGSDRVS